MPEPIDLLRRFTPDSSGLDRDHLLFAAGRASIRPSRRWPALVAMLAVSQLLTLALLWPRAAPEVGPTSTGPSAVADAGLPVPAMDGSALYVLRQQALSGDGTVPEPIPELSMAPPEPPLRLSDRDFSYPH